MILFRGKTWYDEEKRIAEDTLAVYRKWPGRRTEEVHITVFVNGGQVGMRDSEQNGGPSAGEMIEGSVESLLFIDVHLIREQRPSAFEISRR